MKGTIFGLFRQPRQDDPLANGKTLSAWLQGQPDNDLLALRESMVRILEDMGTREPRITHSRALAVIELDRVAAAIDARLMQQFLSPSLSDGVRQRLWHAGNDAARWFAYVYELLFEGLQDSFPGIKSSAVLPGVATRMFHHRGRQALMGLFHYERWIPRHWNMVHATYEVTEARGCATVPYALFAGQPAGGDWFSAEEEFLQILLLQRLNTGNLAVPEINRAALLLRSWVHGLTLKKPPLEGAGFWLDLGKGQGLLPAKPQKPVGNVRYFDVAPLLRKIEDAMVELSVQLRGSGAKSVEEEASQRLLLLQRLKDLWRAGAGHRPRRGERVDIDRPVIVAVGLPRIALALRGIGAPLPATAPVAAPVAEAAVDGMSSPATETIELRSREAHGWRMHDYSESGCRLVCSEPAGSVHRLGALLAVQECGDTRWKVGIIRRQNKFSSGRAELGVEVIAQHAVLITPKPVDGRDSGYSVNGIDVSVERNTFDALYLPPVLSESQARQPTMILPAAEYFEHRRCALVFQEVAYTIELTAPNERSRDWVWTTFEMVETADRPAGHDAGGG